MNRICILTVACLIVAAAVSAAPVEKGQPMPATTGLKLEIDHALFLICHNLNRVYISAWVDPSDPNPEHSSLLQYFAPGHEGPFAASVYLPDGEMLVALDYDRDGRIDETGKVGDADFDHAPCVHEAKIKPGGSKEQSIPVQ